MFDLFNSSCFNSSKIYNDPFQDIEFQNDILNKRSIYFSNIKVIDKTDKDITQRIICLRGWQIITNALQALWTDIHAEGAVQLFTRRINQDCLENCFGAVR